MGEQTTFYKTPLQGRQRKGPEKTHARATRKRSESEKKRVKWCLLQSIKQFATLFKVICGHSSHLEKKLANSKFISP